MDDRYSVQNLNVHMSLKVVLLLASNADPGENAAQKSANLNSYSVSIQF